MALVRITSRGFLDCRQHVLGDSALVERPSLPWEAVLKVVFVTEKRDDSLAGKIRAEAESKRVPVADAQVFYLGNAYERALTAAHGARQRYV